MDDANIVVEKGIANFVYGRICLYRVSPADLAECQFTFYVPFAVWALLA
jgi:hypothetical protein